MIQKTEIRKSKSKAKEGVSTPLLKINNGCFGHNGKIVTKVNNLDIYQGEVFGIVGMSGCGKSTILSAINGGPQLISGDLLIDGDKRSRKWRSEHTSLTLQSFPLFHWLTVEENLLRAALIRGIKLDDPIELLKKFSASSIAQKKPQELSGGERARASLAQAVIISPRILLLDEPFNGLDIVIKAEVADALFQFAHEQNIAVIFVSHDLYDVCDYTDRIGILVGKEPSSLEMTFTTDSNLSRVEIIKALKGQKI